MVGAAGAAAESNLWAWLCICQSEPPASANHPRGCAPQRTRSACCVQTPLPNRLAKLSRRPGDRAVYALPGPCPLVAITTRLPPRPASSIPQQRNATAQTRHTGEFATRHPAARCPPPRTNCVAMAQQARLLLARCFCRPPGLHTALRPHTRPLASQARLPGTTPICPPRPLPPYAVVTRLLTAPPPCLRPRLCGPRPLHACPPLAPMQTAPLFASFTRKHCKDRGFP